MGAPTFRFQVVSLRAMIFDDEVLAVHFFGDEGEYDLLPFHFPLMGALPEGMIHITGIDKRLEKIKVKAGVLMFNENRCTVICQEGDEEKERGILWRDLEVLKGQTGS